MPEPSVHDEFSYLLAADTFANGRFTVTRPTPSGSISKASISFWPNLCIKVPASTGVDASARAGRRRAPNRGACGAALALHALLICWMLLAWLPPRWAALGGVAVALHPGVLLAWSQSYWGGMVAAWRWGHCSLGRLGGGSFASRVCAMLYCLGSAGSLRQAAGRTKGLLVSLPTVVALSFGCRARTDPWREWPSVGLYCRFLPRSLLLRVGRWDCIPGA